MVWTEAPARAKVAGHPLLPIPTATASLPDSTRDLKPANVKVKADGTVGAQLDGRVGAVSVIGFEELTQRVPID